MKRRQIIMLNTDESRNNLWICGQVTRVRVRKSLDSCEN